MLGTKSISSLKLPAPRQVALKAKTATAKVDEKAAKASKEVVPTTNAPSYSQRCDAAIEASKLPKEKRKPMFVPRKIADFDDGGAFPEIHVAQYPRHMGNPHLNQRKTSTGGPQPSSKSTGPTTDVPTSRAIVNVQVDKEGKVSYDAIVKGGTNADKIVYSKLSDMKGGKAKAEDVALPTEEEEKAETEKTAQALQLLLSKKTALDKPSGSAMVNAASAKDLHEKTQFIKYTANPDAPGYNPAAANRVIQMVPAQVDPMEPPKHKHIKAPRGPAEDPVPVLHAPPKKLSKEEKAQWNIPACISNWKNTRGYTIPLDKRLAADGRGLINPEINSSNFANLSESLFVAEQQARQEVKLRAITQKKLARLEKETRESELRDLANQARLERGGITAETVKAKDDNSSVSSFEDDEHDAVDEQAARQREKLRMERKRERERELRMPNVVDIKKQKLEEERDVSEKIALGVHTGTGGQAEVDSRLYNQTSGMDAGFGKDDEYNAYSKPLFDRSAAASIYRPSRSEMDPDAQYEALKSTSRFQPTKGFGGAEGGVSSGPRTAPVQFEKDES